MVRATAVVAGAAMAGYVVSFVKSAISAAYLGTGAQMDVFLWTLALVNLFASPLGGPLNGAFVPVYLSARKEDAGQARAMVGSLQYLFILVFSAFSVAFAVGAPIVARTYLADMGTAAVTLAGHLAWLMIPAVLLGGNIALCSAVLTAEKAFLVPSLVNSLPALMVILTLLAFNRDKAVYAQALGLSLAAVAQWLVLLGLLWRKGILTGRWTLRLKGRGIQEFLALLWPLVGSHSLLLLVPLVDRTIASGLTEGSISALGYANSLMTMSIVVFTVSQHTAALPFLSEQLAEDGHSAFRRTFASILGLLLTLLPAACTVLFALREPLIRLVLERGAFDAQATALTAPAFGVYLISVVPMAVAFHCGSGLKALKASRANAIISLGCLFVLKLAMSFLLVRVWGYLGLALSTAVAYTATAGAMLWLLRRRLGSFEGAKLVQTTARSAAAAALVGLLAFAGRSVAGNGPLQQLAVGGGLALMGYVSATYLFRLHYARQLFQLALKRGSRLLRRGAA